jgi:hypothetical protein
MKPNPHIPTRTVSLLGLLTVLVGLSLPWVMSKLHWYQRSSVYLSLPESHASEFAFIHDQIYREKSPIDILFIGPSLLWSGIDTPYVQTELSHRLGRPIRALTFGWSWSGEGLKNILLRDLLERRKVGIIVTQVIETSEVAFNFHPLTAFWLQYDDLPLLNGGLGLLPQLQLYGLAAVSAPRHLLAAVRPDRPTDFSRPAANRGANLVAEGFNGAAFEKSDAVPREYEPGEVIYGPSTRSNFAFRRKDLSPNNAFLLGELVKLTKAHGTKLAFLGIPMHHDARSPVVTEEIDWTAATGFPLIGIPAAQLFKGLSDAEVTRLYYNDHLNNNGNRFFTRALIPTLASLYEPAQNFFN